MTNKIKFLLNGCHIYFVAEAPKDITLEQLLKQCDKIVPHYCACGLCSFTEDEQLKQDTEILIDYDDIKKANEDVPCDIKGSDENK